MEGGRVVGGEHPRQVGVAERQGRGLGGVDRVGMPRERACQLPLRLRNAKTYGARLVGRLCPNQAVQMQRCFVCLPSPLLARLHACNIS
jgi:hypothetical protein